MKIKILIMAVILLSTLIITSCKKESAKASQLKIRYEITTTQNIVTSHSLLGKLDTYIGYSKDNNANQQIDEQLSGKAWIKEVIMDNPKQSMQFFLEANFYLGASTGSATAKIYVNDKLEAEATQQSTTMPVSNLSLIILGAHYNYVDK